MIGSWQALEALKILLSQDRLLDKKYKNEPNSFYKINTHSGAFQNSFQTLHWKKNPHCPACAHKRYRATPYASAPQDPNPETATSKTNPHISSGLEKIHAAKQKGQRILFLDVSYMGLGYAMLMDCPVQKIPMEDFVGDPSQEPGFYKKYRPLFLKFDLLVTVCEEQTKSRIASEILTQEGYVSTYIPFRTAHTL
jgi:hypothetical protein